MFLQIENIHWKIFFYLIFQCLFPYKKIEKNIFLKNIFQITNAINDEILYQIRFFSVVESRHFSNTINLLILFKVSSMYK
jgi:hypothetical protein